MQYHICLKDYIPPYHSPLQKVHTKYILFLIFLVTIVILLYKNLTQEKSVCNWSVKHKQQYMFKCQILLEMFILRRDLQLLFLVSFSFLFFFPLFQCKCPGNRWKSESNGKFLSLRCHPIFWTSFELCSQGHRKIIIKNDLKDVSANDLVKPSSICWGLIFGNRLLVKAFVTQSLFVQVPLLAHLKTFSSTTMPELGFRIFERCVCIWKIEGEQLGKRERWVRS